MNMTIFGSVVIICITAIFITAGICTTVEKINEKECETWKRNIK